MMETKVYIPVADIYERQQDYLLVAELPGVSKENLVIETEKDSLKIKGTPSSFFGEKKTVYREFEEDFYFERSFLIGENIHKEKIKAKIENGILQVVLPKSEEAKPKKIVIQ